MSELRNIFSDDWCGMKKFLEDVLKPIFGDYDEGYDVLTSNKEVREKASQANIEEIKHAATFDFFGSELKVFDVTVGDSKKLANSKVGIQTVIRQYIKQFEGALIIFHYKNVEDRSWRFSYVERTTNATNTTSAKRYTYILGKNQPTKTITERFTALKNERDTNDILTLADLTKAFSIGSISDDFFDEYKVFYEDFVQFITGNRYVAKTNGYEKTTIHKPNKPIFEQFIKIAKNQKPEGTTEEIETLAQKYVRDYIKKLMGRLVFLQFLQKKGWMGVPKNERYGEGDKNFLQNLYSNSNEKDDFLDKVLEPLFFDTLNTARNGDLAPAILGKDIKIPYLNGGLFEKDKLFDDTNIAFPKELFSNPEKAEKERVFAGEIEKYPYTKYSGLLDFFGRYNFTIDEADSDEQEIGVDPEMLGKIFENLLEDNKDKGAFYTPKEIVQYMCKESLISYLEEKISNKDIVRNFVQNPYKIEDKKLHSELTDALLNIKICDPAIGSGAFPMGMLNELFNCLNVLLGDIKTRSDLKKHIVKNNIYGVDIERGAIDIARLRFWLAIIVDEELKGDEVPEPLPNLDYKFMQGNSLLESYNGIDLKDIAKKVELPEVDLFSDQSKSYNLKCQINAQIDAFKNNLDEFFSITDHAKKQSLQQEIDEFVTFRVLKSMDADYESLDEEISNCENNLKNIISSMSSMKGLEKEKKYLKLENDCAKCKQKLEKLNKDKESTLKKIESADRSALDATRYFLWHTWFGEVFEKGGFDIVIGNPPYGAKLSEEDKKTFKNLYSDVHMRTPETFCYFTSLAFRLAKESGITSYIVPNNLFFQNENQKTRELLIFNNYLLRAINLGDNTFENADVPTCIFVARKTLPDNSYNIEYSDYRDEKIETINWYSKIENIESEKQKKVPGYVLGMSLEGIEILEKIKEKGELLDPLCEEMASGISTGGNKAFCMTRIEAENLKLEKEPIRKLLYGEEMDRYIIKSQDNIIIYSTKDYDIPSYKNIYKQLSLFKEKLSKKRETVKGRLPWWSIHWPRYEKLFTEPKIIFRQTADSIRCVYDDEGWFVIDSILVLKTNTDKYDYKYLSGVLNSKVSNYLYRNFTQEEGRGFAQVKPVNVRKLYIPKASKAKQKEIISIVDEIMKAKKKDPSANTTELEEKIDSKVYELFGLEEPDIRIIEKAVN